MSTLKILIIIQSLITISNDLVPPERFERIYLALIRGVLIPLKLRRHIKFPLNISYACLLYTLSTSKGIDVDNTLACTRPSANLSPSHWVVLFPTYGAENGTRTRTPLRAVDFWCLRLGLNLHHSCLFDSWKIFTIKLLKQVHYVCHSIISAYIIFILLFYILFIFNLTILLIESPINTAATLLPRTKFCKNLTK